MAAGSTGTSSTSGVEEMTMPPECWLMWRGRPMISSIRKRKARQRGLSEPSGRRADSAPWSQPSVMRAIRSTSPCGSASALPRSRMAPRTR